LNNWPVNTGWTDERAELAAKLWKEGYSASQVAKMLGGCSRNAVIGKIHRLGLSERAMPSKPSKPKAAPRVTRRLSVIAMTPSVMQVVPADAAPMKPLPKRDYKPGAHACSIDDIGTHQCRWPLGPMLEPSHLFCGEPLDEDRDRAAQPYCDVHLDRSKSQQAKATSGKDLARSLRRYFTEKVAA
jgi:GcrA cell cycle regulator